MRPKCKGKSRIAERLATARWQNDQHVSPSLDSAGLLLSHPTILNTYYTGTASPIAASIDTYYTGTASPIAASIDIFGRYALSVGTRQR